MRFVSKARSIAPLRRVRVLVWPAGALAVVFSGSVLAAPAQAAMSEGAQPAVWTHKELRFIYQGFTSKFSCDGLRDEIRDVLLQLGARKEDLKVYDTPCGGAPDRPTVFPGVTAEMSVLEPASSTSKAATDGQTVTAHWKTVELSPNPDPVAASGECELFEQVKQKVVPLFAARNVQYTEECVPHQLDATGVRLKADVLVPDQKDTKPPAR